MTVVSPDSIRKGTNLIFIASPWLREAMKDNAEFQHLRQRTLETGFDHLITVAWRDTGNAIESVSVSVMEPDELQTLRGTSI